MSGAKRRWAAWRRRQHAVGTYIVDFFCAKSKLVIEVDGDTHFDPDQAKYDLERTEWLKEQKDYRVIRFTNDEVHHNLEAVLEKYWKAIETPSRCRQQHAASDPSPLRTLHTAGRASRCTGEERSVFSPVERFLLDGETERG